MAASSPGEGRKEQFESESPAGGPSTNEWVLVNFIEKQIKRHTVIAAYVRAAIRFGKGSNENGHESNNAENEFVVEHGFKWVSLE
jgi:hypothetical protein